MIDKNAILIYHWIQSMSSFSRGKVAELLQALKPAVIPEIPEGSRITVHATVSKFAVLYEKIRNAVDYRDDHLLRKAAIVRIFRRQLVFETQAETVAQNLIRELIAARYLPNSVLPESLIGRVAAVIQKYLAVRNVRAGSDGHDRWLQGIIAAEIEEVVDDHTKDKAFLQFLFEQLGERITLKGQAMDETERRLQVYVACNRALSKADDEMLAYKLTRIYHKVWMQPEQWIGDPRDMALQMVGVHATTVRQLKHLLAQKFLNAVKPWATSLFLLREAMEEDPARAETLLSKPEELRATIARLSERKYKQASGKLRRGTRRAIVYLFATKMLLALAIEIPFELVFYKHVSRLSLGINVLFPPVLMFLVGSLIRVPGKDNTARIQNGVEELLSVEGPKGREIKVAVARRGLARLFFRFIYAVTFLVTFGFVYYLLDILNFTWLSSGIFLFFLCIVSFFAFRLRIAAREFVVVERADRLGNVVIDFFSLPILRAGQWLSHSISRINIFIFLFDFVIETPYKIFLNVLEEWFAFLKEKKEELQ